MQLSFCADLSHSSGKWDTQSSLYGLIHYRLRRKRAVSKLPVLRSLRIDINLSEALMSRYGLYLMRRRALFSHLRRRRFAETVRLAMAEIGLIAPISYGVAKAGGRVRLAVLGHQERKVTRFRRLNAFLEFGIQRNVNFNWLPVLILGLGCWPASRPRPPLPSEARRWRRRRAIP
jgi:hypothetical protein